MKRSNVLKTWAMIAALALPMVACDEDEPGIDDKPTVDPSTYGLLILNRGNYNANNASLNLYDMESAQMTDLYKTANGSALGESAQDMLVYGSKIYVGVTYSNRLAVLEKDGSLVKAIEPKDETGSPMNPRYMAAANGKVFAAYYSGHSVAVLDTASLEIEKVIPVGRYPEQLGESHRIVGVCEPRYMDSPEVRAGLNEGRIADLGEATSPNVEKMLEIGTDVIIASPFQNSSFGPVEKLGIPIVQGADYLESLPLGRTEWVKFYGLLFGKQAVADSVFKETEEAYLALKQLTAQVTTRPTVFSEKRYGASWYMPGGESYTANLFRDAGADYLFADLPGTDSHPLSFETVFEKAYQADIWLLKYNQSKDMTYADLQQEYAPYAHFEAFQKKRIYACNTGRIRYYEEFPLHPDYLLQDFIQIFHPELLSGRPLRYYHLMEDK